MTAILEEFHIYHQLRKSEYILAFHGFMLRGDKIALVTEYAENGTLSSFLKRNVTIGWEMRAKLCHDIALGLFHCHEERIVHYTLRPDNIYLGADMVPKIGGFTSQKYRTDDDPTIYNPGGTVHWLAPENLASDTNMKRYYEE